MRGRFRLVQTAELPVPARRSTPCAPPPSAGSVAEPPSSPRYYPARRAPSFALNAASEPVPLARWSSPLQAATKVLHPRTLVLPPASRGRGELDFAPPPCVTFSPAHLVALLRPASRFASALLPPPCITAWKRKLLVMNPWKRQNLR
jgi:hypothetical protein